MSEMRLLRRGAPNMQPPHFSPPVVSASAPAFSPARQQTTSFRSQSPARHSPSRARDGDHRPQSSPSRQQSSFRHSPSRQSPSRGRVELQIREGPPGEPTAAEIRHRLERKMARGEPPDGALGRFLALL